MDRTPDSSTPAADCSILGGGLPILQAVTEPAASTIGSATLDCCVDLINALPYMVCLVHPGPNGRHMFNTTALRYSGYDEQALQGCTWQTLVHPDDLPQSIPQWLDVLRSGRPRELEFRIRRHDGVYRWHAVQQIPLRDARGTIVRWLCSGVDIDDQKRSRHVLDELNRILAMIAAGAALPETLLELTRLIEDQLPGAACSVLLADADGKTLRNAATPSMPADYVALMRALPIENTPGPCCLAAWTKRPVIVGDMRSDPRIAPLRELFAGFNIRACWSIPILSEAGGAEPRLLGTFAVYQFQPGEPDRSSLEVLERTAHVARLAIEHDQTTRALRESEEKFRTLAEHFPDPIFVADPDDAAVPLRILYASPAVRRTHGYTPEEVVGQSLLTMLDTPDTADAAPQRLARLLEAGSCSFEARHRHRDGHVFPLEVRAGLIPWMGRRAIFGIDRDLTQLRQTEQQLKLLEACVVQMRDCVIISEVDAAQPEAKRIVFVNPAYEQATGYRLDEVRGRSPMFLLSPRTNPLVLEHIRDAHRRFKPFRAEIVGVTKDGREMWLDVQAVPITDPAGRATHWVSVERDITRRKRSEEELRSTRQRLEAAQRQARLGVWDFDLATQEVWWSDELYHIFGQHPERFLPTTEGFFRLVYPDDRAMIHEAIRRTIEEDQPYHFCHRIVWPDGSLHWLEASGRIIRDADGRPLRLWGVSQDITDMKRAEQVLRDSEERLRVVLSAAASAAFVWKIPEDEFVRYFSHEPAAPANLEAAEPLAAVVARIHPEDQRKFHAEMQRALADGSAYHNSFRLIRPDGTIRWIESFGTISRDEHARPVRLTGIDIDVTHRQMIEDQLRQSQKLEAIGRLAGGVAHDFNNIVSVIAGYGKLLQRELAPAHPGQTALGEILKASESAANLVRQLLAFGRQQRLEPRVLDLHHLVSSAESLLHRLLGDGVILQSQLHAAHAAIIADRGQIEQVLLNLAVNARDAMRGQGILTMETAGDHLACHEGEVVTWRPAIRLTIKDTGCGMDQATLSNLFQPFYTTKPVGEGTGLGLATVYGIVQQNGGTIEVDSLLGVGTRFILRFPLASQSDPTAIPAAPSVPPTPLKHGHGTILLVEDFEPLRELTARILRDAGYRVLTAHDGEAALRLLRDNEDPLRLLVTDVVMPKLNGPSLAAHLRQLRPDLRVLFLSGYADPPQRQETLNLPGSRYLQKPYKPEELLCEVERLLLESEAEIPVLTGV
jgi:PAS domain S-box-containing protein